MDLQSGGFVDCREVAGSTQDRTLGPRLLDEVREGDLVIRDLGYFDMAGFQRIEQAGAHWLTGRVYRMIVITLTKPLFLSMEQVAGWLGQSLTSLRPSMKFLNTTSVTSYMIRGKGKTLSALNIKLVDLN